MERETRRRWGGYGPTLRQLGLLVVRWRHNRVPEKDQTGVVENSLQPWDPLEVRLELSGSHLDHGLCGLCFSLHHGRGSHCVEVTSVVDGRYRLFYPRSVIGLSLENADGSQLDSPGLGVLVEEKTSVKWQLSLAETAIACASSRLHSLVCGHLFSVASSTVVGSCFSLLIEAFWAEIEHDRRICFAAGSRVALVLEIFWGESSLWISSHQDFSHVQHRATWIFS